MARNVFKEVKNKGPGGHILTGPIYVDGADDVGLAGVWAIEPDEIVDEDFAAKKAREEALHPDFVHLDRIAR